MPIRPNAPASDVATERKLTGPDNRTEEEMQLAEDIDQHGSQNVRVDCNCNAYSKEVITIPHSVIMDQLIEPVPQEQLRTDPRIFATKIASPDPVKPSREFKLVHVMQAAASMRNSKLLPFTPFSSNVEFLKEDREVYDTFEMKYFADLPADSRLQPPEPEQSQQRSTRFGDDDQHGTAAEPEDSENPLLLTTAEDPTEAAESLTAAESSQVIAQVTNQDLPAALREDPVTEPTEPVEDPAASYPEKASAKDLIDWIGNDLNRGLYASVKEASRTRGPRVTVLQHIGTLS